MYIYIYFYVLLIATIFKLICGITPDVHIYIYMCVCVWRIYNTILTLYIYIITCLLSGMHMQDHAITPSKSWINEKICCKYVQEPQVPLKMTIMCWPLGPSYKLVYKPVIYSYISHKP